MLLRTPQNRASNVKVVVTDTTAFAPRDIFLCFCECKPKERDGERPGDHQVLLQAERPGGLVADLAIGVSSKTLPVPLCENDSWHDELLCLSSLRRTRPALCSIR